MEDKLLTNAINRDYLRDEESILSELLPLATLNSELSDQVNIGDYIPDKGSLKATVYKGFTY